MKNFRFLLFNSLLYHFFLNGLYCFPLLNKISPIPYKPFTSSPSPPASKRSPLQRSQTTLLSNFKGSTPPITEDDWKFLDAVYLITTDQSNNQRLQQTTEALQACQLFNLVQIRTFQTDDENRIRGCYTSHIAICKEIQQRFGHQSSYQVLIVEDNIEITRNMKKEVLTSIQSFLSQQGRRKGMEEQEQGSSSGSSGGGAVAKKNKKKRKEDPLWDIFHLAYMMYVPGLKLLQLNRNPILRTERKAVGDQEQTQEEREEKQEEEQEEDPSRFVNEPWAKNIVQMFAEKSAVVGTSAYIISKNGVEQLLARDAKIGFTDAIPNIMTELFPETRFACFPMIFHRAGKVNSLVNPQLDNFRKVMFNPIMYTIWEKLMVGTGLRNNELFPTITISLVIATLSSILNILYQTFFLPSEMVLTSSAGGLISESSDSSQLGTSLFPLLTALFPLLIALWGASLFKPGNTGKGFAKVKENSSSASASTITGTPTTTVSTK